MKREWLPFFLFAAGVALIILAIFWSLYAYGEVGRMVAAKGLRPANSFHCLMAFGGSCDLLSAAHAEKGTVAYSPLVFWAGVAGVIGSFVLNLLPREAGEAWGIRLQRLLIPVDRVSTYVGQFFAWSILLLTLAWDETIDALADGLLTGQALYDAELIIIGGGLAESGETLLAPLRASLMMKASFHRVPEIVKAKLGDEAGCLGAALLALELL